MGAGYPLDLVVCVALGVDMFDCVYPTRTARFGVAFVPSGTLRLKSKECARDLSRIHPHCGCTTCKSFTRASLHTMFKENNPMASQLLTKHNIYYMMTLMRTMRKVRVSIFQCPIDVVNLIIVARLLSKVMRPMKPLFSTS